LQTKKISHMMRCITSLQSNTKNLLSPRIITTN